MGKDLFNYNVPESQSVISDKLIDGLSTGIIEPNSSKYEVFYKIYKNMIACRWVPEEVDMTQDAIDFKTLMPAEQRGYGLVLSQLIFMDSIQTNNSADNVNPWVTEPTANACLVLQSAEEALHSDSYYLMTDTVYENSQEIYDMWKTDPVLRKKNEFIGNIYETHGALASEDDRTISYRCALEMALAKAGVRSYDIEVGEEIVTKSFDIDSVLKYDTLSEYMKAEKLKRFKSRVKMVIANQCLEGIYFNAGFLFIYLLGRMGKMLGSVDDIRFINRDELNHLALYANIFKIIYRENKHLFDHELLTEIRQMFIDAAMMEIEWGIYVTQNQIVGIDDEKMALYIKWLANDRFKILKLHEIQGLQMPFPEVTEHPIKWVDDYSQMNKTKTDFFEGKVKNYDQTGLNTNSPHKVPFDINLLLRGDAEVVHEPVMASSLSERSFNFGGISG